MPHAGDARQPLAQRLGVLRGDRALDARWCGGVGCQRLEDGLFGFRAEALERADPAAARGLGELLQGRHAEPIVERAHPLRAEVRDLEQLGDGRWQFVAQLFQRLAAAGGDDLRDLRREVVADAGQLAQILAARQHVGRGHAQHFQFARGIAVGTHAKRIGSLDLEQVGDLPEYLCDVGVVDAHQPLMHTSGSSRATLRASPAAAAASTTAATSL